MQEMSALRAGSCPTSGMLLPPPMMTSNMPPRSEFTTAREGCWWNQAGRSAFLEGRRTLAGWRPQLACGGGSCTAPERYMTHMRLRAIGRNPSQRV
jgi:hypothetical protein